MAVAFPAPSPIVVMALDELRLAAIQSPESTDELRRIAALPRPWDPASCPPSLRGHLWRWLDEVAGWINEEHTWRVDRIIPACWPEHPHIVHELGTVACLRHAAQYAVTPDVLEDWHRYTLPMFLDRVAQRVGPNGCPPGKHQPNPGAPRARVYGSDTDRQTRRARQDCDVGVSEASGRVFNPPTREA